MREWLNVTWLSALSAIAVRFRKQGRRLGRPLLMLIQDGQSVNRDQAHNLSGLVLGIRWLYPCNGTAAFRRLHMPCNIVYCRLLYAKQPYIGLNRGQMHPSRLSSTSLLLCHQALKTMNHSTPVLANSESLTHILVPMKHVEE